MSATTAFAFDARVIACNECGAPLPLGSAGGREACSYCGSEQSHPMAARQVPREPQPLDEPNRLARLRQADAGYVGPPGALQALFVGERLVPWKVGEALSLWKTTRDVLRSPGAGSELAEQLYWLTKALAAHFAELGEPLRERSLLESALEILERARHRQALCAALARSACHAGDLTAAEQWLGLCDPRSSDLESDSAYRFACATLETARGRFAAVHQVLGATSGDVPISNEHEAPCVALRAHGWEQLGRTDLAVEVLDHFGRQVGAFGRYLLSRYLEERRAWGLCRESYPLADERQRERGFRIAGKTAGAPTLLLAIAAAVLALTAATAVAIGWLVEIGWGLFAAGCGGFVVTMFLLVFVKDYRRYRRHRRLRAAGTAAAAQVQFVHFMKEATLGVPLLLYRLLILPVRGGPFEAYSLLHADPETRRRLAPGALAVARVDPEDHDNVALEVD